MNSNEEKFADMDYVDVNVTKLLKLFYKNKILIIVITLFLQLVRYLLRFRYQTYTNHQQLYIFQIALVMQVHSLR
mgnify:CR=1 FL=1